MTTAADAAATVALAAAAPTNDGNQPENADTRPPNHGWATLLHCKSLVTLPKRCRCSFSLLNKTAATLLYLPCNANTTLWHFFSIPAKNLLAQSSTAKKIVQPAFRHKKAATGVAFSVTSFAAHSQTGMLTIPKVDFIKNVSNNLKGNF